jgi:hypothetical protein
MACARVGVAGIHGLRGTGILVAAQKRLRLVSNED